MTHIGLHHVQAELIDHLAQLLDAFFVGGDLGLEVSHVLLGVTAGIRSATQAREHVGLTQCPAVNKLDIIELDALFFNAGRERRH